MEILSVMSINILIINILVYAYMIATIKEVVNKDNGFLILFYIIIIFSNLVCVYTYVPFLFIKELDFNYFFIVLYYVIIYNLFSIIKYFIRSFEEEYESKKRLYVDKDD